MNQSERMKKYWEEVKAGKKQAPSKRHKKPWLEYKTEGKYGPSMRKARRLRVRIHHDTLFIKEEKLRERREYSMDLYSVYAWIVRSTVFAELQAKRNEKKKGK